MRLYKSAFIARLPQIGAVTFSPRSNRTRRCGDREPGGEKLVPFVVRLPRYFAQIFVSRKAAGELLLGVEDVRNAVKEYRKAQVKVIAQKVNAVENIKGLGSDLWKLQRIWDAARFSKDRPEEIVEVLVGIEPDDLESYDEFFRDVEKLRVHLAERFEPEILLVRFIEWAEVIDTSPPVR